MGVQISGVGGGGGVVVALAARKQPDSAAAAPASAPAPAALKRGRVRHALTLMALSAFVLANMNRQAYNQGLSRMKKREPAAPVAPVAVASPPPSAPLDSDALDPMGAALVGFEPRAGPAVAANSTTSAPVTEPNQDQDQDQDQGQGRDQHSELDDGDFEWTSAQVGLLQAAFSYGYTPFMIPGGRLSELYGSKWVIFLSSFGSSLCSLLTPFLASHNFYLLVGSRILMGVCQTGISPAMYAFSSRWLHPNEASVYLPMVKVGIMIGFMLGSILNGLLPWRTMFYLIGLAGLLWSAVWALFASSDPSEHKFIKAAELAYIKQGLELRANNESLAQRNLLSTSAPATAHQGDAANSKSEQAKDLSHGRGPNSAGSPNSAPTQKMLTPTQTPTQTQTQTQTQTPTPTPSSTRGSASNSAPWWGIVSNPVVLAFTFTKFTVKMSTDAQSMQIPMYLKQVFNVSNALNGALNGANFAIQAICTGFVAYTAKEMVVRRKFGLNKTGVRILFQSISSFGMGLAYLLISLNMGSMQLVCGAVIILCSASMFGAGGEAVLPIDLTTEYSASIMAIANSVANLSGILLPPIVSHFLANEFTNSDHWNRVWWFISSAMICGGLAFACLVQAKIQDFGGGGGGNDRNNGNNGKKTSDQNKDSAARRGNGALANGALAIQMEPDAPGGGDDDDPKSTTRL